MKQTNTFRVGDKVTTSGYPGTIREVCAWADNRMVVVHLKSGQVCVPVEDVEHAA